MIIQIEEGDVRLKPGMTATCHVVVETIPPRPTAAPDSVQSEAAEVATATPMPLYIPLDAVFEKDGRTLVYRLMGGQPEEREVKLGQKNEDFVIIEEGLAPGDHVALRDPLQAADASGLMEEADALPAPQAH